MSSSFRTNLAQLVSPLRRVRPNKPFFQLPAHRIPTLALYRALVKQAWTDNIRDRVRYLFRANRHLTGTERTKRELLKGYKWLKTFQLAHSNDIHSQKLLDRYDKFIVMKREKARWIEIIRNEIAWRRRLRHRAILTGGFMYPTLYNGPMPRMKPQPRHVTGLRVNRLKTLERRVEKTQQLTALRDLGRLEQEFERAVQRDSDWVSSDWTMIPENSIKAIQQLFKQFARRASAPFPPALLDQVKQARREKIANKTKERTRERRGEILPVTLKRARQRPTAHVLSLMTEQQKKEDELMRQNVTEVGYLGVLKARHGWKVHQGRSWGLEAKKEVELETSRGRKWSVEDGEWVSESEKQALERKLKEVRRENKRRRRAEASQTEA
ncbi:hypothetical protein C8J56DRAFT_940790 [Mycena floridula]|nr:hypothetical protein C8J56DRAFT_940790 [Mycena floridula]